jgi:cytidine deaminase
LAGSDALITAARDARERAVAPFSRFKVGAALETEGGAVITGCNIENASYGLTMCAERVAIFKAVSEGHRTFRRIAIVADTPVPTAPCGACRQILWEYAGNILVILADLQRVTARYRMNRLLPAPFDADVLRGGRDAPGSSSQDSPGSSSQDSPGSSSQDSPGHRRAAEAAAPVPSRRRTPKPSR